MRVRSGLSAEATLSSALGLVVRTLGRLVMVWRGLIAAEAVGEGVILATSDGGARWKRQGRVSQYYLEDAACTDASHAWAVRDDGSNRSVILATADGGATCAGGGAALHMPST